MVLFVATLTALTLISLAIVFGGTCVLAFLTAPSLSRRFERRRAGDAFGMIMRRFDLLGLNACILALGCSGILLSLGEHPPIRRALFTAVGAVATLMALLFVYSRHVLTPQLKAVAPPREPGVADPRTDAERARYKRLHMRHVHMYSAILFLSLGAVALHALPI